MQTYVKGERKRELMVVVPSKSEHQRFSALRAFKTLFRADIFCTTVVSFRKMVQRTFLKIGKLITLRLKVNIYVFILKQNIKCSISLEPYFHEEFIGR